MKKATTIILLLVAVALSAVAQERVDSLNVGKNAYAPSHVKHAMLPVEKDSLNVGKNAYAPSQSSRAMGEARRPDAANNADTVNKADTTLAVTVTKKAPKAPKQRRDWTQWKPDVKKALWLAIVIPGGGQIYNRKYWKLPIIYGGIVGCIYALRWNGQMYKDYSQAYQDIMDDDPTTKSYEQFLHLGAAINDGNMERYKTVFKNRKDRYRRWRDLSLFCMIGVYGLSIVDAYVDASLSQFDISDDLSLKVAPAYINNNGRNLTASRDALQGGGLGVRCRLTF